MVLRDVVFVSMGIHYIKTFAAHVILPGAETAISAPGVLFQFTVKLHGIPVYGNRSEDCFQINVFQLIVPEKLKKSVHLTVGEIFHNQHFFAEVFSHGKPGTGRKSRNFKKVSQRMKQIRSRDFTDVNTSSS